MASERADTSSKYGALGEPKEKEDEWQLSSVVDKNIDRLITASKRRETLQNRKESSKARLTKACKHLAVLLVKENDEAFSTKTDIRRAVRKVNSEVSMNDKIVFALKETVVLSDYEDEVVDVDFILDSLDRELEEIMNQVDEVTKAADEHLRKRIADGEEESEVSSIKSIKTPSIVSSTKTSLVERKTSLVERRQREAKEAKERLVALENEQQVLEDELKQTMKL